jgi:hypothetical protein
MTAVDDDVRRVRRGSLLVRMIFLSAFLGICVAGTVIMVVKHLWLLAIIFGFWTVCVAMMFAVTQRALGRLRR